MFTVTAARIRQRSQLRKGKDMQVSSNVPGQGPLKAPDQDAALRQAAEKLEASFLAEMLKCSGVGETSESFGGGPGEEQFASFLREAQADKIAQAGGLGLAEVIYQSLKARD